MHRRTRQAIPLWGLCLVLAVSLTSCGDDAEPVGDGVQTLTATLQSPQGAEGAVLVSLTNLVGSVTPVQGSVVSQRDGAATRILVVAEPAGPLSFAVQVIATNNPPEYEILQVAGPDDALRTDLSGYTLEFTP